MFQKLLKFLMETDSILLIKYDGEREKNKYTVKLIYNDLKLGSLGKDSDKPQEVIKDIFDNQVEISVNDALSIYWKIADIIKQSLDLKYGSKSIITITIKKENNCLSYNFHVQSKDITKHGSAVNLDDLVLGIINNQS